MATRSYITIKVKDTDLNTIHQYEKPSFLFYPKGSLGWQVKNENDIVFPQVKIEGQYMTIYHHWDGYPSGLGKHLLKYYPYYENVFKLILGGAISTLMVEPHEIPMYYQLRVGEDWEYLKPIFNNTIEDLLQEDYHYLYDNGKWFVKGYEDKVFKELTFDLCQENY